MRLSPTQIATFQEIVWEYGRSHYRTMPWRENTDPYHVLVSEMMLQQTSVGRVLPKFAAFVARFPKVSDLADAPLEEVLKLWSGLGYNRRAKFLWQAAQMIMHDFAGHVPRMLDELVTLPGVGPNTAAAIAAYGYNQPVVFVETNIRTVFFHHFWPDADKVTDAELREVVAQTLDHEQPRQWYWALMDYGTFLKATTSGYLDTSAHYKKQSPFAGSRRQTRGAIIRSLLGGPLDQAALAAALSDEHTTRFAPALSGLLAEKLVSRLPDGRLGLTD